jgi:hypothetical protein
MKTINYTILLTLLTCLVASCKEPVTNEVLIKAEVINFDDDTGLITISLENLSDSNVLISEKDILHPSYSMKSENRNVGASGGSVGNEIVKFIRIFKHEKKQISFKLRGYDGIKAEHINSIELQFSCECYFIGESQSKDVEFSVRSVVTPRAN